MLRTICGIIPTCINGKMMSHSPASYYHKMYPRVLIPNCSVSTMQVQGVGLCSKGECSEPHFAIRTPTDVVHMRTVSALSPNGGDGPLAVRLPRATDPRQRRRWQQTAAAAGVSVSGSGFRFGWALLLPRIGTQNSPDARAARLRARPLSVS